MIIFTEKHDTKKQMVERGEKACCVTHDILLNQIVYEARPSLDHQAAVVDSLSPSLRSRI
jgi:hypothetical protein